jgi:hypothetical protein
VSPTTKLVIGTPSVSANDATSTRGRNVTVTALPVRLAGHVVLDLDGGRPSGFGMGDVAVGRHRIATAVLQVDAHRHVDDRGDQAQLVDQLVDAQQRLVRYPVPAGRQAKASHVQRFEPRRHGQPRHQGVMGVRRHHHPSGPDHLPERLTCAFHAVILSRVKNSRRHA